MGNLRVRISDPQKKSSRRKIFEIFLLETSTNDRWRGGLRVGRGGGVASALVLRSSPLTCQKCPFIRRIALLFSRIILLFSRNTLLFPEVALLFSKSVLLFHRSAFLFLKNASFFSRIVLENCPELPSFCFLCASFFFFPS